MKVKIVTPPYYSEVSQCEEKNTSSKPTSTIIQTTVCKTYMYVRYQADKKMSL